MHRVLIAAVAVAVLAAAAPDNASAHAALAGSDPRAGATLGAAPTVVRLTFAEQPQASLSTIRVLDSRGAAQQSGAAAPLATDRLTLAVPTPRLGRGLYTVRYRVVSAVDGHSSEGSFAFGVGVSPKQAAAVQVTSSAGVSGLELVARWVLLVGLTLLVGACAAGGPLKLAGGAWVAAAAGLALLAVAQVNTAGDSLGNLLTTPVGHALVWRTVAIGAAGAALLAARRRRRRRSATALAGLAALAAIAVHVAAGHAAAGPWSHALTVAAQTGHFAAAGVWIGGLAALLLTVRGAASEEKAAAVRRFSTVALAALVVVAATGTFRAIDELRAWSDLADTGYGRAIVAKVLLLAAIVALGARHRRRSVPAAATDLEPLRRTSRPELVLAAGALAAAALLGTLAPPPVLGQAGGPRPLTVSGADSAATVRVELTAASPEPGPNRFTAKVEDYRSRAPVPPTTGVRLRFTPLDDPGTKPTALALRRQRDGAYAATGPNLAFDGRWGVTAEVESGAKPSSVPLELDVPGPPHFVSALRVPGQAPQYTMQLAGVGYIRITPNPERAGPSTVTVDVFDAFESYLPVSRIVVTAAKQGDRARQLPVERIGTARFRAPVVLDTGRFTIDVIAHTREGDVRLRGSFDLDVSG
jgi:copper transport protein